VREVLRDPVEAGPQPCDVVAVLIERASPGAAHGAVDDGERRLRRCEATFDL
jgi:hypothetical protein